MGEDGERGKVASLAERLAAKTAESRRSASEKAREQEAARAQAEAQVIEREAQRFYDERMMTLTDVLDAEAKKGRSEYVVWRYSDTGNAALDQGTLEGMKLVGAWCSARGLRVDLDHTEGENVTDYGYVPAAHWLTVSWAKPR